MALSAVWTSPAVTVARRATIPRGARGGGGGKCWGPSLPPRRGVAAAAAPGGALVADTTTLGASGPEVSHLGIGTGGWANRDVCTRDDVDMLFEDCILRGVNFFDTSESFGSVALAELAGGFGEGEHAESLLGSNARLWGPTAPRAPVLATTYITLPWAGRGEGGLAGSLKRSLARAGRDSFDLVQIHFPFGEATKLMGELRDAHAAGLAGAVGVCNYDAEQLQQAHELLGNMGVPLASHQFSYSLLDRSAETNGVFAKCQELGITPIAHTPLAGGKLVPPGTCKAGVEQTKDEEILCKLLEFIGSLGYQGKTSSQVALNYLITKGAVPVPGCCNTEEAADAMGALGWRLDENDMEIIDEKLKSMSL